MRVIKSLQDINTLKQADVMNIDYLNHIEDYFHQLWKSLSNNESKKEFNLANNDCIVILEKGDNLKDLSIVGLNREDEGLLGSYPETIEEIDLESISIYRISVLYTNQQMVTFYSEVDIHNQRVEEWFNDNAIDQQEYFAEFKDVDVPF